MKKISLKIVLTLSLIFAILSCKGQTFPLRTAVENVPNLSHFKDINNELSPFVGKYSATYNGKQITLFIIQENNKLFNFIDKDIYIDVLSIKYIVKNSSGATLQDTQSMTFPAHQLRHTIYSQWAEDNGNKLLFYYGGTNCGVGWGRIELKKLNNTQISWEYRPNDIILDDSKCPPGTDINIYLPEAKDLLFTKQ